jgi:5-methylcytosine-specific restriction endonuclease McrA
MIQTNEFGIAVKKCFKCKMTYTISEFNSNKTTKDGLGCYCRDCSKRLSRRFYHANPETASEYNARKYAENPEKFKEKARQRVINNPEKVKAEQARYREGHKEEFSIRDRDRHIARKEEDNARVAKWKKEHPEMVGANCARRRAQKKGAMINDLTASQWIEIIESYDGHCCYCGCTDKPLTKDHIRSLKRGGNHTASNVAPACGQCNSSKGTKMLDEWLAAGGFPLHAPYRESFGGEAV